MVDPKIRELEKLIGIHEHRIRTVRTNQTNTGYVQRTRAWLVARVEDYAQQLVQLEYDLEHGDEIVEISKRRLKVLRSQFKTAKHTHHIEKLREMQQALKTFAEESNLNLCSYTMGLLCPFSPEDCRTWQVCEHRLAHLREKDA